DGIDDPAPRPVSRLSSLLAEHRVARPLVADRCPQRIFHGLVGLRDDAAVRLVPAPQRTAKAREGDFAGDIGKTQREGEVGLEGMGHRKRGASKRKAILQRKARGFDRTKDELPSAGAPIYPPWIPALLMARASKPRPSRSRPDEPAGRCGMTDGDRVPENRRASLRATILIGIGVMAAVDEIVFH